jgi:type IV fimbrial biogenesis protein FimT
MQRTNLGFTLFELLMTVALAAIILTIGLPSFSNTLARNRQNIEINALFHAIHLAREESIRRREVMTVCASSDQRTCSGGLDWSAGWILFNNTDRDSPPQVDPGEAVVMAHRVDASVRVSANRRAFTFRATYRRATNGTLVFCERNDRIPARALVVSYTGRPRVAATTPNGTPHSCAD